MVLGWQARGQGRACRRGQQPGLCKARGVLFGLGAQGWQIGAVGVVGEGGGWCAFPNPPELLIPGSEGRGWEMEGEVVR